MKSYPQGTSVNIEGQAKIIEPQHIPQLVATTVVASFIEKNNHPELNSAILIDSCYVCMYVSNVLLLSEKSRFN